MSVEGEEEFSLDYFDGPMPASATGHTERPHAILGASSMDRWGNCPGSIRIIEISPPARTSIYAQEGTAAHTLCEFCYEHGLHPATLMGQYITYRGEIIDEVPDDTDVLGTDISGDVIYGPSENPSFPINAMMSEAVQVYLEAIREEVDRLRKLYGIEPIVFIEKRFNLSELYPDLFGTNDCGILVPGHHLSILDYKHGKGKVVEIELNKQLRYYALGALLELCRDPADMPKTVRTTVVQPRARHRDGLVRHADYTVDQIRTDFANELVSAAIETTKPDAAIRPGEWCFFCPGNGPQCPALQQKADELAQLSFMDLDPSELGIEGMEEIKQELIARSTVTPEQVARILENEDLILQWLKGCREYATHISQQGERVPGFKLVRGRKNRIFADPAATEKALVAKGVPADAIKAPVKLKTPAQMEKLKVEGLDMKAEVAGLATTPQGPLVLASLEDIRDEVVVDPFADLSLHEDDFIGLPAPAEDFDFI